MTAKCLHPTLKRDLTYSRWPEKDSEINMPYNLRKKPKSLDISSGNNEVKLKLQLILLWYW